MREMWTQTQKIVSRGPRTRTILAEFESLSFSVNLLVNSNEGNLRSQLGAALHLASAVARPRARAQRREEGKGEERRNERACAQGARNCRPQGVA